MRIALLLGCLLVLAASANGQADTLALDPGQFVNTQILGDTLETGERAHSVYTVEPNTFYAFDGRLDVTFPVTIVGPDNGWIKEDATPPVLVNTPDLEGAARQFFELQAGGSLVMKNLLMTGSVSTGETGGTLITNTGASLYMAHNVAFANWQDFLMRNQAKNIDISITDCVFINGTRTRNSPWGGFPIRMDVAGENVTIANNTVVNSGRLLTNSGPFFNATIHEVHNTYLNSAKAGHEQRANEMIQANNIYFNYDFLGRKDENAVNPNNTYDSHWTTWNYYHEASDSLDQISLYLGQNLFFREQGLLDWFAQSDTLSPGLLWEHAAVDSFVLGDSDYTIGTNYADFDPGFTTPPGNSDQVVAFTAAFWTDPDAEWVDWRIDSPVTFDANQQPVLNWPPAFDLSYSNEFLKTAGTDGLPLGDLNWYPAEKASFLENQEAHIAALRDSVNNATAVYVPGSPTPMIRPMPVSIEDGEIPVRFNLDQNYPNPFNPTTSIGFTVDRSVGVNLTVYDLLGKRVAVLMENELIAAGSHSVQWDGRDALGNVVSSGMYIYRIEADGFTQGKKMLLMK